jgi:hypothetical protein
MKSKQWRTKMKIPSILTVGAIVSGFSPAIMAAVLGADPEEFTPWNMTLKTIMNDRYSF